jgi:putative membrane protein
VALLAAGLLVLAWSAVRPHDYFTWFMEVAPIFIGVPILLATRRRFRSRPCSTA